MQINSLGQNVQRYIENIIMIIIKHLLLSLISTLKDP